MKPLHIRFCGFGGQGIVLISVLFGTVVVTRRGLFAVQTQSYGSEARGGQCQAELIISDRHVNSPISEKKDLLVAIFQPALDKYHTSLAEGGCLVIDPMLVKNTHGIRDRIYPVPATETAIKLGNRIAANMVLLGYLQAGSGLFTREDLIEVVREHVPRKFVDLNLQAVEEGIALAGQTRLPLYFDAAVPGPGTGEKPAARGGKG